ncbi:MAG TPA: 2-hydroxyacyl-CoA dehydratase family protein [Deltaproteobacteria bacterium]|nr:2-hydroxyacyl-CoA dehydratase family protein [Deltaproteobacteria bacterium]HOI06084.1 2-hydroxyacyl-CoA dehydratase family protein [Deltaproteobacteria bacterium]
MKREIQEYPNDWILWSILHNASMSRDGTPGEYQKLLGMVPHFRDVLHSLVRQGEPGVIFLKLIDEYMINSITAHEQGKKAALTSFCVATPILYAFDVVPLSLEVMTVISTLVLRRGTSDFLDYCCELGFTETSCSAQRGSLGAYLAGIAYRPDMVVCDSPGICDTNANSFAFAAAYMDLPFYHLSYPPTLTDDRSRAYELADFRNFISFLEGQTGTSLDEDRLREVVNECRVQDELSCELMELQRIVPSPVPGIYDVMLYGGKFMMSGRRIYSDLLRSMLDKAKENASLGRAGTVTTRERARGLFCYIDHFTTDFRFWNWMDEQEITHLGSLLFTFWQGGAPYAWGREDEAYSFGENDLDSMLVSLSGQMSRMPMVKQIRGPYDAPHMCLDDTLGVARLFKPDFVAYLGTMGCRNTWGMVKLLARDMEKQGYPFLILYGDAFDDRVASWEAIQDKMDEFMKLRRILR